MTCPVELIMMHLASAWIFLVSLLCLERESGQRLLYGS